MNLAIIPARSGSKRIRNKNIKLFFRKPIIYYSINMALKSKIFDKVIVSTDSKRIKKIAEKYGAEVPFIRPKRLSGDFTSTHAVIKHALNWYSKRRVNPDYVCCIYPISPLLSIKYLVEGYKKIITNKWKFVFSASKHTKSVFRSFFLKKNLGISMIQPKYFSFRTQDLGDSYFDAGNFYWGKKSSWLSSSAIFFSKKNTIVNIPNSRTQDVDNKKDWNELNIKYKKLKKNK